MSGIDEATELEFLRYFYDQASLSMQERYFLEEGFELCFNKKVPKDYKININDLIKISQEQENNQNNKTPIMSEEELARMLKQTVPAIPKPPKMPRIDQDFEILKGLVDSTQNGDYELIHKRSGEHVSLSILVDQLKYMAGLKND